MSRPRPNTFVLGDAFDDSRGLHAFPDNSVDHIITDPPFNEHVHGGNRRGWETKNGKKTPTKTMEMQFGAFTEEDMIIFSELAVRICRGWLLLFCALEDIGTWKELLEEAGAKRRNTCVWTKTNCAPKFAGDGPANAAEAIVTVWCGKGRSVWNAGGSQGLYHYPVTTRNRRHETEKPIPLMRQLLIDFTRPGELVLDPFAGGGSTLIAAKQLGRKYIGYELGDTAASRRSYRLGCDAIEAAREQTHMQQIMLHKRRRDSAYGGKPPKQIAIQADLPNVPPKPKKRPRPLIAPVRQPRPLL